MEPLKSMSHRKPNDFINLFFYGVQVVLTSTSGLIQHETGMSQHKQLYTLSCVKHHRASCFNCHLCKIMQHISDLEDNKQKTCFFVIVYYLFKTLEVPYHKERSPKSIGALPFTSLSSKWVKLATSNKVLHGIKKTHVKFYCSMLNKQI